jgi:hypothetical protein
MLPLWVTAGVAGLVIATNLIDFAAAWPSRLLNANLEVSWSHRATAITLAVGSLIALLRAARASRDRRLWAAGGASLLLVFVVEASPVHVQVDRLSYGKLVYLPLLVALSVSVWRLAHGLSSAPLMRAALGALVAAYAIHIFGLHVVEALGWGTGSWAYQLKVGLKEGAELAGWLLLVLVLWRLARVAPVSTSAGRRQPLDDRVGSPRKLLRWAIGNDGESA